MASPEDLSCSSDLEPIPIPYHHPTNNHPATAAKPKEPATSLREWIANSAAMQELKRKRESRGFLTPDGKRVSFKGPLGKRKSLE